MYLNSTGYYIPEKRIKNDYFATLYKLPEQWFYQRTGILSRSRASDEETINEMSIEAVNDAVKYLPYTLKDIDLIIFASYTPEDTVATTAHVIQCKFQITKAKVFYISSACSSALNGMEIIRAFFQTGLASRALLIAGDKNSMYSNDNDTQSGHLWGDGVAAFFFSKEPTGKDTAKLIDISTQGLGHVGLSIQAVSMRPKDKGIQMPHGKDVFMQACTYLVEFTSDLLEKNRLSISDLSYFICHQANMRIISHVGHAMGLPEYKILNNIGELGNTGCGSALLVYAQNKDKFCPGDTICLSVFGGGYSGGACLLRAQ